MKYIRVYWILIACLPRLLQAEDATEIMRKVYDRPDGDDFQGTLRMTLTNHRGSQRVREMSTYSKDYPRETRALTFFRAPADVRGTGFLQYDYDESNKDDDRWLYLPALKKSKRIGGSSNSDSFMGSDFTYDDWGGRKLEDDTHSFLREDTIDGHAVWVIESRPVDKGDTYGRFINWIRKDALIEVKTEFYDRSDQLLKVLDVMEIKRIDGYWTASRMIMRNVQDKHQTLIEQLDILYDQGLDDGIFRVSSLERGRIR